MKSGLVVFLVSLVACTSGDPQLASTTTLASPPTTGTSLETTSIPSRDTTAIAGPTTTTAPLTPFESLAYEEVTSLPFPIHLVPRNSAQSLVATKDGQIYTFQNGVVGSEPILDISSKSDNAGERGLLAIAVHPDDDSRLFIHYSANDGDTVVEEYSIEETGQVFPEPVAQLLSLDQPAGNHNGGMIQFGPDGALYLGLGDGGASNDRFGNGQNRDTLLGGLVRIDVDDPDPTLYQYGLRNPWRFWIDGSTIYIADVGQRLFEEVSVASFQADLNFGWPITEGLHCFRPASGCDTSGLTLPVIEVGHGDDGTCSITGGILYQGAVIPEVANHFFYSDFCGQWLRSFRYDNSEVVEESDWTGQVGKPGQVASFGVDHEGEMYVLTTDRVLKVVPVRG